ncbi:MAG: SIS domain-containing protein [Propionibacteriaceae bacterium]|nr:SIS domain-containing protein [Propionibacteriaceae bacterium]
MNGPQFDDSRLESPDLEQHEGLRWLATAGARIRRVALAEPHGQLIRSDRPRGVLAMGAEARLVRGVLEPACPVPFMAWPGPGLPAWVGPLDLAVILGSSDTPGWIVQCAAEAKRRGASLIVAAPEESELARVTASSATTLIPLTEDDPVAAAVSVLAALGELGLGPVVHPELVADAADLVAESCAPSRDLSENPGKELALVLADRLPLIWGGTTLAARASRRVAEAVRRACGRPALAADAGEIRTLLTAAEACDPFADPFDDAGQTQPVLVLLDDTKLPDRLSGVAIDLADLAESRGLRVVRISSGDPELGATDVERYITLLLKGLYGAAYLEIGLTNA